MGILKEMYKQLPKTLLRNKWDLNFILSKDVYEKEKHKLNNGKFMGISVEVCYFNAIPKDTAYLSETKLRDGTWR